MSSGYHESGISERAKNIHRALASLQEELEAIDWYQQRADAAEDQELRDILVHNQNEEIEHAGMLLEYLRRHEPQFDEKLRTYLFTEKPITAIEEDAESEGDADAAEKADNSADKSLGIGSLR